MFLKYGNYMEDVPEGNIDKTRKLFINSCGTYRLKLTTKLPTERPHGRKDYQLIYIASGKGYFFFNENASSIQNAGDIIIYHPGEMQKYIFYGKDQPEVYWIHFTGADIDTLLSSHHITSNENSMYVGINQEYIRLFEKIIFELQSKKLYYEESAALLFSELLILFGRYYTNNTSFPGNIAFHKFDEVTAYFQEHYNENINIESYIESIDTGLCPSLFFRQFKEYTGQTPLQFILDIRLSSAKNLLETTDYSINKIASVVGYENALYFSRLFHKHVGMSPKEYRKFIRGNN